MNTHILSQADKRLMFGLKLRQLRQEKSVKLVELSAITGISVSYLTEIEKGKKYPKSEKVEQLASALGIPSASLTSFAPDLKVPASKLFQTRFFKEFPFEMLGINKSKIVELLSYEDVHLDTIVNIFTTISLKYPFLKNDLLTLLWNYQNAGNTTCFEESENTCEQFLIQHRLPNKPLSLEIIESILCTHFNCQVIQTPISTPLLSQQFQSLLVADAAGAKLYISELMTEADKKYLIAREIGYRFMNLMNRSDFFPCHADSYERLSNDIKANYFANALLINKDTFVPQLQAFFNQRSVNPELSAKWINEYGVSAEILIERIASLLPRYFDADSVHVQHILHIHGSDDYTVTKTFPSQATDSSTNDGSSFSIRKIISSKFLKSLINNIKTTNPGEVFFKVARTSVQSTKEELLQIACITPSPEKLVNQCILLTVSLTESVKKKIKFWNDVSIPVFVQENDYGERSHLQHIEGLSVETGVLQEHCHLE